MRIFTIVLITILFNQFAIGQADTISIKGKIVDKENKQPLMFANVVIYETGSRMSLIGTETDLDGNYSISNLDDGFYDIEVSYVGYTLLKIERIRVVKNTTTAFTIELKEGKGTGCSFPYVEPLIRLDHTTSGRKYTSEDLKNSPIKN